MFFEYRGSIQTIIIFALILHASSSDSRNIKRVAETFFPLKTIEDLRRVVHPEMDPPKQMSESPERGFVNLDEGAIATLSKLANIRLSSVAEHQLKKQRSLFVGGRAHPPLGIDTMKNPGISYDDDQENTSHATSEKLEFRPRKFHCHPIEDVFIPAADKKLPAYICKLDLREFIISSERFIQDPKHHLDVAVDETTFHRLIVPDETVNDNLMGNVIPVTLTQRQGDGFYGVKTT